jgi:hypothetical protein
MSDYDESVSPSLEREWDDFQHWHCPHGYLVGFGCPDCDADEDDACDS